MNKISESKDKIQRQGLNKWWSKPWHGRGTLQYATGTGKTRCGVLAAAYIAKLTDMDARILILTPTETIRDRSWKDEFYKWIKTCLELSYKQLKPTGSLYLCISWQHSHKFHQLLEEVGFTIQNRITWKRDKGRGSKINWKSMHEDVFFATKHKTDYTFNVDEVMIEKDVVAPYTNDDGTPKGWWINSEGKKVRLTYPGNVWVTENASWALRVGAQEKSKAEAQALVDAAIEGTNDADGNQIVINLP